MPQLPTPAAVDRAAGKGRCIQYTPRRAQNQGQRRFVRKNRFRSRTAKTKPGRSGTEGRIFRRQGLFKAAGNKGPGKRTGMKAPPPEKAGPEERGMQQETAQGKVEKAARQGKHPSGRDTRPRGLSGQVETCIKRAGAGKENLEEFLMACRRLLLYNKKK